MNEKTSTYRCCFADVKFLIHLCNEQKLWRNVSLYAWPNVKTGNEMGLKINHQNRKSSAEITRSHTSEWWCVYVCMCGKQTTTANKTFNDV